MKRQKGRLFFLFYFAILFCAFAQQESVWLEVAPQTIKKELIRKKSASRIFKTYNFKENIFKRTIKESNTVEFPDDKGNLLRFTIRKSQLLHPSLAAKFPGIQTYVGQQIDDKSITVHFTVNHLGLYAMILRPEKGTIFIDPYTRDRGEYMVYLKKDVTGGRLLECQTVGESILNKSLFYLKNANDLKLRTFRLAVATTEEYSDFHCNEAGLGLGNTRQDSINVVMSAIAVTMNRVNPIYERDVALTMQLVPDNDQLIFLSSDPGTDPYSNDDGSTMLNENQVTIDNVIGISNYDIGHVFSTGGGGVAFLASVCTNLKAGGVTGSGSPVGDSFDVDLVAHEMGHQFGANHTFNGTTGNCNGNRVNATAVEPGSGSTIMAYAGICSPQNVQSSSDAYFHAVSIQEMYTNITAGNGTCALLSDFVLNANRPNADAGNDYTIPKSTPFALMGSGTDLDGDELTFCWEQIDNEVVDIEIPPSSTQTEGAVFRSLPPKKTEVRYMPSLTTVMAGNTFSTWEVVPDVSRTMDFALTVRDNVAGEGQSDTDITTITVTDTAGPFVVTSQNIDGIVWEEGTVQTVTWNVAGTDANGINVDKVNILLSLDGGLTFPTILVANTPNDGQEDIIVPNSAAADVRVMVAAVNNIFFAVNSHSFSIGIFETTCTTYTSQDVPFNVPDNNPTGIISSLNVLDDYSITDVNVSVDITHTWLWDLQIYLQAPDGTEVLIYDRSCGSAGEQREDIFATFDDGASVKVCENVVPAVAGISLPDNSLSDFNGLSSFGEWKLRVVDNAAADIGTLNSWSLELCQTNQTVAVEENYFQDFMMYPNPFSETFRLRFMNINPGDVDLYIYDIRGRLLIRKNYDNQHLIFDEEINLENLSSGVFILRIQKGTIETSRKIVKY